jgi:micrococcal nuclease
MSARSLTALTALVVAALLATGCPDSDDDGQGRKRHKRTRLPRVTPSKPFSGRVTRISDGDTLWVTLDGGRKRAKIRLHGIDTPERAMPFGERAHRELRAMAADQRVRVVPLAKDRYRRVVGKVFRGERDLGAALLGAGLAWHYKRYDKDPRYAALERQARQAKRGLWAQTSPQAPWDFRRRRRIKRSKRRRRGRR